jgi:hypothetical protein
LNVFPMAQIHSRVIQAILKPLNPIPSKTAPRPRRALCPPSPAPLCGQRHDLVNAKPLPGTTETHRLMPKRSGERFESRAVATRWPHMAALKTLNGTSGVGTPLRLATPPSSGGDKRRG